jgi:VWFA-related protein
VELTDLISICVLDGGLRVLHHFSADRAELQRKLSAAYMGLHEGPPGEKAAIADFSVFPTDIGERSPGMDVAERRNTRALEIRRNLDTFSVIEQIASYLGSASGRKSMIWVTSGFSSAMGFDHSTEEYRDNPDAYFSLMADDNRGFSPEINRVIRRFNDANIAVYPVDARGVIADERAGSAYVNRAPMNEIAKGTGGRAYYDANDLDNAIRSALDDSRISYTLGYYPANSKNDGKYRNVSVKVQRPGVTLRYRTGYEAEKDQKSKTAPKLDLQQALGSPLDSTGLPLSAHAVRAGGKLDVRLRIDPSSLTLRQEYGRRKGGVSVSYAFRSGDSLGKVQVFSESNKLDLPEELYPKLLQQGVRTFRKQLPIPANATSLRLVIRDQESGSVGSITIPLAAVH